MGEQNREENGMEVCCLSGIDVSSRRFWKIVKKRLPLRIYPKNILWLVEQDKSLMTFNQA